MVGIAAISASSSRGLPGWAGTPPSRGANLPAGGFDAGAALGWNASCCSFSSAAPSSASRPPRTPGNRALAELGPNAEARRFVRHCASSPGAMESDVAAGRAARGQGRRKPPARPGESFGESRQSRTRIVVGICGPARLFLLTRTHRPRGNRVAVSQACGRIGTASRHNVPGFVPPRPLVLDLENSLLGNPRCLETAQQATEARPIHFFETDYRLDRHSLERSRPVTRPATARARPGRHRAVGCSRRPDGIAALSSRTPQATCRPRSRRSSRRLLRYASGELVDFQPIRPSTSRAPTRSAAPSTTLARKLGFGDTTTLRRTCGGRRPCRAGARNRPGAWPQPGPPSSFPCHRIVAAGGKIGGFSAPGGATTQGTPARSWKACVSALRRRRRPRSASDQSLQRRLLGRDPNDGAEE